MDFEKQPITLKKAKSMPDQQDTDDYQNEYHESRFNLLPGTYKDVHPIHWDYKTYNDENEYSSINDEHLTSDEYKLGYPSNFILGIFIVLGIYFWFCLFQNLNLIYKSDQYNSRIFKYNILALLNFIILISFLIICSLKRQLKKRYIATFCTVLLIIDLMLMIFLSILPNSNYELLLNGGNGTSIFNNGTTPSDIDDTNAYTTMLPSTPTTATPLTITTPTTTTFKPTTTTKKIYKWNFVLSGYSPGLVLMP